jgi:hypothetical protein
MHFNNIPALRKVEVEDEDAVKQVEEVRAAKVPQVCGAA